MSSSSSSSPSPRVVVTGMGQIGPLGNAVDELWTAIGERRSGVAPLEGENQVLPIPFGAVARDFTGAIDEFGPLDKAKQKQIRKGQKMACREIDMAVAASQRALGDAGLAEPQYDPARIGVIFGSDYMATLPGEFTASVRNCLNAEKEKIEYERWGTDGLAQMNPLWLLKYLPNMPASHVAIYNDLRGPNNSITQREASGNIALGEAMHIIGRGWADCLLVGATGTRIHPLRTVHVVLQEEIAPAGVAPEKASRPFDLNRTGMVLGEASAVLVLERLETAQARGAKIYGEVVSYGSSAVAGKNLVARRQTALTNAMKMALRSAQFEPRQIGHVHAHGLSTRQTDVDEAQAINEIFGPDGPPVAAAKSYFGNVGAAAGIIEIMVSLLSLEAGRLPPILNYETPDPECPIRPALGDETPSGDCFVNLSVSPQGQASAAILRRFV